MKQENQGKRIRKKNHPTEKRRSFGKNITLYRDDYIMLLPGLIYFLIFAYAPLWGLIIAFQDYYPLKGIFGSEFVGLKHFKKLFTDPFFARVFKNTIIISVYKFIFGFPAPILLALCINEIKAMRFKKTMQSISYLPHFLSWVVVSGIMVEFLSPSRGPINVLIKALGMDPIFFIADKRYFRGMLVMTDMWKSIGWGSIIYLSSIASVDQEIYEAAMIDGAGRFKRIIHITLPALVPLLTIMLIMESGKLLNDSFQQVYNFLTPTTEEVGDVISTFVYRKGILQMNYSFSTAVNLTKNIISFVMVVIANTIANRVNEYALW